MKLNITILEDNEAQKQHLQWVIENAAKKIKIAVRLFAVSSGLDISGESVVQTDLFFLDVETPHRSGIETAQFIRTVSKDVPIVFTTNFKDYAVNGYEVHAFQFLLKPVTEADCIPCLENAIAYVKLREQGSLKIKQSKEWHIVSYGEILYAEAGNHSCKIVYDGGDLSFRKNISDLAKELPQRIFIQCHRSYLVNIDRIRVLNAKELILDNQAKIPVSESYFAAIEKAFADKLIAEGGLWS
ncbi:LytTR family DNA-binding domain-containing protein [Agathobaculum sp. NTUH-O15-33]|uniref:LytR/AlgR family response regulator transcription factor n=1 Tax=Agathobaculum sp. NTUH-O15-33 TaxID=3079302 RepID=UPI0029585B80|nr:LytTR family DNA-binding domain-containing protein [Agathobaculum sp. NTUH-O15-33]WNX86329.1 LytTR family DNA-binding domain-containing protein [Agathobaculum sp. NTUH-O15-33]